MTATMNGTERRAAIAAWQAAAADGRHLTGTELAEQFGRSPGWGRGVIREARHVPPAVPPVAAAPEPTDRGNHQATSAPEAPAAASLGPDGAAVAGGQHGPLPRHQGGTDAVPRRPWYDSAIVLVVAAVAAAASYGHMYHLALLADQPLWIARAWPITVDGLVVAALRRGQAGRPWLLLGLAISVAANVVAGDPELAAQAGPVVSAWPPLALYGTHRLLHRR